MSCLGLRLTPHGHLVLEPADDAPGLDPISAARLAGAFARGTGPGLLQLGAGEVGQALPPALAWWRGFAARYVTALCLHHPNAIHGWRFRVKLLFSAPRAMARRPRLAALG